MTDGNHREHGIRPNTQAMITFAAIARWGKTAEARQHALEDLIATLRFVAPTHSAGPLTANDGKKWQNQWQSALWAFYAGTASWMIWEQIEDDELRWLIANFITSEADRFVDAEPPFQIKLDTKAEENAWNSTVVALAANMFPRHPRRSLWIETANRWQLSSLLTEDDIRRKPVIDGKSLKEWRLKANIHPDYTMENHDRVHPSYMATFTLLSGQHFLYTWGGLPTPEALDFNSREIYEHLKYFSHTDGRTHYPNGQDWELTRYTPMPHAAINVRFKDPEAALLERTTLEAVSRMQDRTPDGTTLLKSEFFFPSLQQGYAYWYGIVFLFHAVYGEGAEPASQAEFDSRHNSVRWFEHGEFVVHRSQEGFTSFAWGNRVMGMAIPFAKDLLGTPYELGYVGSIQAEGEQSTGRGKRSKMEIPQVKQVDVFHTNDHFTVSATLHRADGKIEQQISFVSLPGGIVFYAERLKALEALTVSELKTAQIGVLNMPESVNQRGPRLLRWKSGEAKIDGREKHPHLRIKSNWLNIDDQWGFIALTENTWRFEPNHEIQRGRREQSLYLNPPEQRQFTTNELIATRAVLTTLNQKTATTEQMAKELKEKFKHSPESVRVALGNWSVETVWGE
ncbi:MAG: hypothetical protein ACK4UN_02790, partial [Limisphaerales bacterium]